MVIWQVALKQAHEKQREYKKRAAEQIHRSKGNNTY